MNRLFGSGNKAPKPTLNSATAQINNNIASLDVQIAAVNTKIKALQTQINRLPEGPGKRAVKERALNELRKRKRLEALRDGQENQVFNMEGIQRQQDSLKGALAMVDAMKTTQKELRKQYGKIDLDKIERMQDDMADLVDMGNEIQESLSRGFEVPDDVDEEELDAELELLGSEMEMESALSAEAGGVPDFMRDEVPDFIDEPPESNKKVQEAAR